MRRLFILVMVCAVAYGGYWAIGSRSVNNAAVGGLADLQAAGWDVRYDALKTRGFPSRFDTSVTELALTSPAGITYQAPFLQALALSYRPNRMIVAFPNSQTLSFQDTTVTLASDGMRASGAVKANTALSFAEATLVADLLAVSTDHAGVRMRDVLAAARRSGENQYDVYAGAELISLPGELYRQMFPSGEVPLSIDSLSGDATVSLDAPLDRFTQEVSLTELVIKQMQVSWGEVTLSAAGSLTPDPDGLATGQITLEARNADTLLTGFANIGVIDPGFLPTYRNMIAAMTDDSGLMTVPLNFANGLVSWGFIPLGPAPRF